MCRKLFYYGVLLTVVLLSVGCGKEERVESVTKPIDIPPVDYPYTTNHCVYVNTSSGIEQYMKNGTKVGDLKLKDDAEVLFVAENWLYYVISDGGEDGVDLYRIPVQTEENEDIIHYGSEEKILTESDGIRSDNFYVKGDYLVYITNYHEYKKYNLESSDFVKVKGKKANCTWGNEDNFNDSISEKAAYLWYIEKGIYRQNFQDDSLSLIEREPLVCSLTVTPKGVFYIVGEMGKEQIKVYNEEQNESTVFIDTKQLEQAILSAWSGVQEGTAKDMFYVDSLFINDSRLFIKASLCGENASYDAEEEGVIFSCSLDDASDLYLEKDLTDGMKKLQTVSDPYNFDIQKVIDGNILFTFYNKTEPEKLACYDLTSGTNEEVQTEKTKEWLLQYYNSSVGIDLEGVDDETDNIIQEIESEFYDTSGQSNYEFGGGIVENSEYIFYTSKNALVQIKKDTMEKSLIRQWKKKSMISLSLYCTESELYYIKDAREVYSISLEDGKQQLLWTYEMLEKAGYVIPEIWGMAVYSGCAYLELCGFDIVQCEFNGHIGERIAQDARSGAFWENAFFYVQRSSHEIHRFDLETMEENMVREKEYEERVQYRDIFTIENGLYYSLDGAIYLYDESGKDVKVIEERGFPVEGKDAIYYIKEEDNVEYLYIFNVQTKQTSSLKIHERIIDEYYTTEVRMIHNMLFYTIDKKENRYKILPLKSDIVFVEDQYETKR